MPSFDTDFFVIGGGSGGVRAARIAASHGARVMLAEEQALGGTCVNVGCVPKKIMVMAGEYSRAMADAAGFGWSMPAGASHDWAALKAARDAEIERLHGIYRRMLEASGVEILPARAKLAGPQAVEVGGRTITAERILVATGGRPTVPPGPLQAVAWTSDDMFALAERPQRVAIIGGGYIGVEFANILRGLGSDVQMIVRERLPLRGFDEDLRIGLAEGLQADGIVFHAGCNVAAAERREDGTVRLRLDNDTVLEVDGVLAATGRRANSAGLGLEAAGVALAGNGSIPVDADCATAVPSIFALGDVAGHMALTPVAIRHGHRLADRLFGNGPSDADFDAVPTAVFSNPPLATCGMTEHDAVARGLGVDIYRTRFTPMRGRMSGREELVTMKLIVDSDSQRVLGCHMIGQDAPEIMQGFALAVSARLTKGQVDAVIGIHPTVAEEFVTLRTPSARHEPVTVEQPA